MEPPFKIPDEPKIRRTEFEESPEKGVSALVEETEGEYAHISVKTELGEYEFWFSLGDKKAAFRVESRRGSFGGTAGVREI